jgi:membrane protein
MNSWLNLKTPDKTFNPSIGCFIRKRLGSIITAFLFIVGKTAIGFYLTKTDPGSAYGAAGSIVLILLWVSYSSMIFFYGAEFTRATADHLTGAIPATEVAVNIKA